MDTETKKIALNTHVPLRTANSHNIWRPERHVDDNTDMRRYCRLRQNTSGRCPLGSSSSCLRSLLMSCDTLSVTLTDTLMNPLFAGVGYLLLLKCIFLTFRKSLFCGCVKTELYRKLPEGRWRSRLLEEQAAGTSNLWSHAYHEKRKHKQHWKVD